MTMIIDLPVQAWAHISKAISDHIVWCRTNGIPIPAEINRLGCLARTHANDAPLVVPAVPVPARACKCQLSSNEIYVDQAADVLDLTPRRVRTLAAEGLGRKVGSVWVLDAAAVRQRADSMLRQPTMSSILVYEEKDDPTPHRQG